MAAMPRPRPEPSPDLASGENAGKVRTAVISSAPHCPIFLSRKACWREKRGCYCEEDIVAAAASKINGVVLDMAPDPKQNYANTARQVGTTGMENAYRKPALSHAQKVQRCKYCVIFNEHEREKYHAARSHRHRRHDRAVRAPSRRCCATRWAVYWVSRRDLSIAFRLRRVPTHPRFPRSVIPALLWSGFSSARSW